MVGMMDEASHHPQHSVCGAFDGSAKVLCASPRQVRVKPETNITVLLTGTVKVSSQNTSHTCTQ